MALSNRTVFLLAQASLSCALVGCNKTEAPTSKATEPPATAPAQNPNANPPASVNTNASAATSAQTNANAAQPSASAPPAAPVASTDIDSPTPLPALSLKGVGIKKPVVYYYTLNAGVGTIKLTATAKNLPSGSTQALRFGLYDAQAGMVCADSHGNTTTDKTLTLTCKVDKAQALVLRLDLSEETIDYAVTLEGPVELPAPQAAGTASTVVGAGSTDIDAPTRLQGNRIRGEGSKQAASYYYTFNGGPGELTVTADGKNVSAPTTDALKVSLYNLRSERLCDVSLGNSTLDKRQVMSCKIDKRQPIILRLDLSPETIDYRVKFEGPYDFDAYTAPKIVTIALDSAVLFDTGKFDLKPEARQTLHEAAERVKKFADASITIAGYTDNVGKDDANLKLSGNRATAVQTYFVTQESIPASRLSVKAYGKAQPVADNASEEGRARNRRVEVLIAPK